MVMKFLGKIISFILSLILLIGELVMHVFIGMQILLMINERSVIEQYLGLFAGYFKSSFFMEYYNLLLNPLVRTAFYVLIIIIIILIIAFNNRIALSLREIGLVTFITSIPFLLLSLGWLSLDGIIPADRMEQYRKFFHGAFHTSSLVALAIGAALYFVGTVIREIQRRLRQKKKEELHEQRVAERERKLEERKAQLKSLFASQNQQPDSLPVEEGTAKEETEVVKPEEKSEVETAEIPQEKPEEKTEEVQPIEEENTDEIVAEVVDDQVGDSQFLQQASERVKQGVISFKDFVKGLFNTEKPQESEETEDDSDDNNL